MLYRIPTSFSLASFEQELALSGVYLSVSDTVPVPDGYLIKQDDDLEVCLSQTNGTKEAAILAAVQKQGGSFIS